MSEAKEGRTTAIIAYITIVGCCIAITRNLEPKYSFARFHARQAFGIHLLYHGIAVFLNLRYIEGVWFVLYGLYAIGLVFGILAAYKNRETLIPAIGLYFQKWFTFIS